MPLFTADSTTPAKEAIGILPVPVLIAYSVMCLVALGTTENRSPATFKSKLRGMSVPARSALVPETSNHALSSSPARSSPEEGAAACGGGEEGRAGPVSPLAGGGGRVADGQGCQTSLAVSPPLPPVGSSAAGARVGVLLAAGVAVAAEFCVRPLQHRFQNTHPIEIPQVSIASDVQA
jgi:hypothetical protein